VLVAVMSVTSVAACGTARSTPGDAARADALASDPLIDATLPGAHAVGEAGKSVGAGSSPGASPSIGYRRWEVDGPPAEPFAALLGLLRPSGWSLEGVSCEASGRLGFAAVKNFPTFFATASATAGVTDRPRDLTLFLTAGPDQGVPVTGSLPTSRPTVNDACPPTIAAAVINQSP